MARRWRDASEQPSANPIRDAWRDPAVLDLLARLGQCAAAHVGGVEALLASIGVEREELANAESPAPLLDMHRDVLPMSERFTKIIAGHITTDMPHLRQLLTICDETFRAVLEKRLPPLCASICGNLLAASLGAFSGEMLSTIEASNAMTAE